MDYDSWGIANQIPKWVWEKGEFGTQDNFQKLLEQAYYMGCCYATAAGRHEEAHKYYYNFTNRMTVQMERFVRDAYLSGIIHAQCTEYD